MPRTRIHPRTIPQNVLNIAVLGLYLFCTNTATAKNIPSPKEVVIAFYTLALIDFQPKEAFAQYAAPDFVEPSSDSAGTVQSTVDFLTGLIKKSPQPKWEIIRVIAEDDMVFRHVHLTPAKGATPIVIGEIFRVRDGELAEHWDIIQQATEHSVNPNSVF